MGAPHVLPWGDDRVNGGRCRLSKEGALNCAHVLRPHLRGRPPLTPTRSVPQGIWRIPVDEIDRPGSFAWHMNRSVVLLLKVLAQLRDHGTLLKVSSMLQRTPDQGK